jgi:subtilisin family serine protease
MSSRAGRKLASRLIAALLLPALCISGYSTQKAPFASREKASFKKHPQTTEWLKKLGYKTDELGWLIDIKQPNRLIPLFSLNSAGLHYDEEGLFIKKSGALVSQEEVGFALASLNGMIDQAGDTFEMDSKLAQILKDNGFSHDNTGQILHKETGTLITRERLFEVGLNYDRNGSLVYQMDFKRSQWGMKDLPAGRRLRKDRIINTLNGLMQYDEINGFDSRKTGDTLKAWKIPPAFDGVHLLNPDGTATYYGKMLYKGLRKDPSWQDKTFATLLGQKPPEQSYVSTLTKGKLSKAIGKFKSAFGYSYKQPFAFAYTGTNKEGFDALRNPEIAPGDSALPLIPNGTMSISEVRQAAEDAAITTTDAALRKDLGAAIKTLNALENRYYHKEMDLKSVPRPRLGKDKKIDVEHDQAPLLLATLKKIMPEKLTEEQTKAILWEMPMGETIVRMKAYKFWAAGRDGEGVNIGVIDAGASDNPELHDAVGSRKEFINQAPVFAGFVPGTHGTHVSGTIHAVAPKANINSYDVFDEGGSGWERIMAAVDTAVADGNHVINMSLGGMGSPTDELVKRVEMHAKNGVIFNISAGNSANERGIGAPSIAEGAYSIGAETVDGQMADFSSYGRVYNPDTMSYLYKKIYMAPGTNIVSTAGLGKKKNEYQDMNGTSMAAPHATGASALLVQELLESPGKLNPISMSETLRKALDKTSQPMDRSRMPKDLPKEQEVVILDPWAAFKELKSKS